VATFGESLLSHGFSHHGGETMISGLTGAEFHADIYIGLVYYQRLRHMVSDKFQVRSIGPINPLTHQPIKGRKAGGGIRFGEMERDSLLAHGASFLLHDRLHLCSDRHVMDMCAKCNSLLATGTSRASTVSAGFGRPSCGACASSANIESIAMPYVFKYLCIELAAMNIKLSVALHS
jgi:DNA-directed RNA polymerase I subunit RPA2